MAIKRFNPYTPGRRFMTTLDYSILTRKKPEKRLIVKIKKTAGRNNCGRITSWHRGGGSKKIYRIIDFKRDKKNIEAVVKAIEYDPNRTAFIALLCYLDGEKRYILAPDGLKVGDKVVSGDNVEIKIGNCLPLGKIPLGTLVHNVELQPGKGGQIARSAGSYTQIVAKEGNNVHLRMPSGEIRIFSAKCLATVGQVSNLDNENVVIGKAGRLKLMGRRPHVRGSAMNPIDHPHGGGEGKSKSGRNPVTPWGQPTRGYKTRKKNKTSSKFIVKRRK